MHQNISRIYKGSELVYSAPDTQQLAAFLTDLKNGDRIELFRSANIRTDAIISTTTLKGVNPNGARGTVVGGPKTGVSNSIWYNINFDVGFDGWCVSDNYSKIASTTTQTTPSYFKVGDRVRLFRAANVRTAAGVTATLKGVNPMNTQGVIMAGPTKVGTTNWYNINFDTGFDGWVVSDNYVIVTTSGGGGTGTGGTNWITGSCAPAVPSNGKIINVAAGGSIQNAVNSAKPGDTIVVANGTYNAFNVAQGRGGTADGWLAIKSATPLGAKITNGKRVQLFKADYIKIEGFEFNGKPGAESGITATACHHLQIINNRVNIGSIYIGLSDFFLVEGNVVHGKETLSPFNQMEIIWPQNITGDTTTRNRIIIRNNVSYSCRRYDRTDGNGIIIDTFTPTLEKIRTQNPNGYVQKNTRVAPKPYTFGAIVDNNIFYDNFGAGIYVNWSDNITVTNNICYKNHQSNHPDRKNGGPWQGEIVNISSSNNVFKNNVAVTADTKPLHTYAIACFNFADQPPGKNNTWTGNITYNTSKPGDAAISTQSLCPIPAATNKLGQGAQYATRPTDFLKEPCS